MCVLVGMIFLTSLARKVLGKIRHNRTDYVTKPEVLNEFKITSVIEEMYTNQTGQTM